MKNIIYFIITITIAGCHLTDHNQSTDANNTVFDTVIAGGHVMDPESGLDAIKNVGILDGTIQQITDSQLNGVKVIDATGLVVAPGFIDTDSYPANASLQIADGVTTVLSLRRGTGDIKSWYETYADSMIINFGASISYHDIRKEVMGDDGDLRKHRKEPTKAQFEKIISRINEEFDQGAIALGMGSSGGFDPAGWELIEIFKSAADRKAPVIATLRDDFWPESNITANLLQMIGVASLSGANIHIPHVGSSTGPHIANFLEVMTTAQTNGISVTAEDYFYRAAEIDIEKGDLYMMSDDELEQIQPMDSDRRLTRETIGNYGEKDFEAYYHNDGTEPFIIHGLKSPLVQVASHGSTSKWTTGSIGHPRSAATYTRVLRKYVREESVITLMEALRKMSLMPANLLSERVPAMKKKGRVQIGADADLVLFNPAEVMDKASYTKLERSSGMEYVLVNGSVLVDQGSLKEEISPGEGILAEL